MFEDYPAPIKCMTTFLARPNRLSSNRSLGVNGIPSIAITESGSEDGTRHDGTSGTGEVLYAYQGDTPSVSSASSVLSLETPNTEVMADVIFVGLSKYDSFVALLTHLLYRAAWSEREFCSDRFL